jgi:hypothetical protein
MSLPIAIPSLSLCLHPELGDAMENADHYGKMRPLEDLAGSSFGSPFARRA